MTSRREQILQAAMETLAEIMAPGVDGYIPVDRDPMLPTDRSTNVLIVVDWKKETVATLTSDREEVSMMIEMAVQMRAQNWTDQERTVLDGLMSKAHKALMSDRTLGGLCQAIYRRGATRDTQVAGDVIGEITHAYEIIYRHKASDLEAI